MHHWDHLRGLQLADPQYTHISKIDVLLGADIFYEIIEAGKMTGTPGAPIAINSALGWILVGRLGGVRSEELPVSTFIVQCELDSALKRFWELEEIPRKKFLTPDEKACEDHFTLTHSRTPSGRFIVRLPLKENVEALGDSRSMAVRRFLSGERKNCADPAPLRTYQAVMEEYLQLGHMERVPKEELHSQPTRTYYMPHHAVENATSSTTPFRVVFDASATSIKGASLNQNMLVGPKLQDDLVSILIRFRSHRIAMTADIPKMYRQILVHRDDIDLQRIVWRNNPREPIQDFRLLTATFGTASAPYLVIRSVQQLARDEEGSFPEAAAVVLRDFYVDDLMSGAATEAEALSLQQDLMKLVARGGMSLRKWSSNSSEFLSTIPADLRETEAALNIEEDNSVEALGLQWHPAADHFSFRVAVSSSTCITKRTVLSEIAKVFDPLGWLSPATITAKILMQRMWKEDLGWDEDLPPHLRADWIHYQEQMPEMEQIRIPRFISQENGRDLQLHGFCDASEAAYAAVIFLRSIDPSGTVVVRMVAAKAKVSPAKNVSLPRLELCGAVVLVRLMECVKESLGISCNSLFGWTDSTIVLAWLSSPPHRWKTFVANRVSEIQDSLPRDVWNHVKSDENPADCASRGISPAQLNTHHLWWHEPAWLSEREILVAVPSETLEGSPPEERAATNILHVAATSLLDAAAQDSLLYKYSDLGKVLRITAYCQRAATWMRKRKTRSSRQRSSMPPPITAAELDHVLMTWVKLVQQQEFPEDCQRLARKEDVSGSSKLKRLSPFMDKEGIIRVGGRLQNSALHSDSKHQIVLPKKHRLTELIISSQHSNDLHAGPQALLSSLQQRFWILSGRDVVRKFVRSCVKCCRYRAQCGQQMMGQLPAARITSAPTFQRTGVDYAGPYILTARKGRGQRSFKGYIALFVCLVTRAIHLELVSDLTTDAFLAAFRRFVSRRGKLTDVYSDNGTNFVGAKKILDDHLRLVASSAHNHTMQQELAKESIHTLEDSSKLASSL